MQFQLTTVGLYRNKWNKYLPQRETILRVAFGSHESSWTALKGHTQQATARPPVPGKWLLTIKASIYLYNGMGQLEAWPLGIVTLPWIVFISFLHDNQPPAVLVWNCGATGIDGALTIIEFQKKCSAAPRPTHTHTPSHWNNQGFNHCVLQVLFTHCEGKTTYQKHPEDIPWSTWNEVLAFSAGGSKRCDFLLAASFQGRESNTPRRGALNNYTRDLRHIEVQSMQGCVKKTKRWSMRFPMFSMPIHICHCGSISQKKKTQEGARVKPKQVGVCSYINARTQTTQMGSHADPQESKSWCISSRCRFGIRMEFQQWWLALSNSYLVFSAV